MKQKTKFRLTLASLVGLTAILTYSYATFQPVQHVQKPNVQYKAVNIHLGERGKYTAVLEQNNSEELEVIALRPTDTSTFKDNIHKTCLYQKDYSYKCSANSKRFVMQDQDKEAIRTYIRSKNYLSGRITNLNRK